MRFVREDTVTSSEPPAERFSAGTWRADILPPVREGGLRAYRFTYNPGARSHWHTHEGEQALIIVAGRGVVTRWGEERGTRVGPGHWVHVEPGEKHWHGAVEDDTFVHLAVTATGGTIWQEAVSEEQYRSGLG